ncbi:MAG TPA: hypothetical protein RMH99_20285 [Sandaracinaceae bacterium LLY-WYZ-13_1]|nr:hypothetical protein [Sandaracinaceae bacterium LLY-WYZ-13_1]
MEHTADSLPGDREAVDPELLELPTPPRGRRLATLALMAVVVVASMALVFGIRHDLAYFFAPSSTVDLGDVQDVSPASLEPNTHVRIQGTPMMSRAVRYQRVLTGGTHVVFPLAGQRTVYVQVPDDGQSLARTEFSGRLVTFSQLGGRIGSVERYLGDALGLPVSGESFLLIADESPGSYAWALLVAILCALFVLVDLVLILRWFRPIERGPDGAAEGDDGAEPG